MGRPLNRRPVLCNISVLNLITNCEPLYSKNDSEREDRFAWNKLNE